MSDSQHILEEVLAWSKDQDYAGHSKHDALNSPVLELLSFGLKVPRLVYTQTLMRLPINMRGLCGVPRLRNPKGVGLFAHALLDRAAGEGAVGAVPEADDLLKWLIDHPSPWADGTGTSELRGMGWGYHYPWQDAGFFQPRHFPNRVVTSWIALAFIRGYEVTGRSQYLDVAQQACTFLLDNPRRLVDTPDQLCLSYVPLDDIEVAVMDVSVLTAAVCAWVSKHVPERVELRETARRLTSFVADKQTDYGAWFYTWPAKDSHITHDNYHTGIILDCIADVMRALDTDEFMDVYRKGLEHYRKDLFLDSGAPKWMNDKEFPHDIHGAAAGILCFTRAAQMLDDPQWAEQAEKVLNWTLSNLYSGRGCFYYQRTRWVTKRFCLMRWCNGWMCRALAQQILLQP